MESNQEDLMSEFSYTQSEHLNLSSDDAPLQNVREPTPRLSKTSSNISTRTEEVKDTTRSSMERSFEPFAPLKAPIPMLTRDSYISSISEYSGKENNNIAEPVSVQVVNQERQSSVSRKYISSNSSQDIPKDLNTGSLEMGKLETSSSGKGMKIHPRASFSTSIEGSVPSRSPRRPRSEIMLESQGLARDFEMYKSSNPRNHKHKFSLNITDDLEKLMDSASSMSSDIAGRRPRKLNSRDFQNDKSDMLGSSSTVSPINFNDYPFQSSFMMDKDSSDDLYTAKRPASISLLSGRSQHHGNSVNSIASYKTADVQKNLTPDTASLFKSSSNDISGSSSGRVGEEMYSTLQGRKLSDSSSVPLNIQPVMMGAQGSRTTERQLPQAPEQPLHKEASQDHTIQMRSVQDLNKIHQESRRSVDSKDRTVQNPQDQQHRGSSSYSQDQDDEYIDIEEPALAPKQSKTKSTKESSRKSSKTRKSRSKKGKSVSSQLKPFSYSTLINLLESMNGTIIGEEFSQLDLPFKEKQLIEKIVDSLSRLTSDMVIDDKRYEVGITRLENALRVLEGFM